MASPNCRTIALVLCFFLGYLGIHRFYVGKVGTGIIWLVTAGLLGFGVSLGAGSAKELADLAHGADPLMVIRAHEAEQRTDKAE